MPYTRSQRLTLALVPPLAAFLIRLLGRTLRYQDLPAPGVTPGIEIPGPTVFAFWHRTLLLCAYRFRNRGIAILISRSFDGELIARTVARLGFLPIRGSSTRGGPSALKQMAEAYRAGHICAFTADGPRGPAQIAKPGPAHLAALAGAPWVGAFHAHPTRAWTLRTWDHFIIPKPFSTVCIAWPPHTPPDLSAIQESLNQAVETTETNTRNAHPRPSA